MLLASLVFLILGGFSLLIGYVLGQDAGGWQADGDGESAKPDKD